jgi:hypothetical protein
MVTNGGWFEEALKVSFILLLLLCHNGEELFEISVPRIQSKKTGDRFQPPWRSRHIHIEGLAHFIYLPIWQSRLPLDLVPEKNDDGTYAIHKAVELLVILSDRLTIKVFSWVFSFDIESYLNVFQYDHKTPDNWLEERDTGEITSILERFSSGNWVCQGIILGVFLEPPMLERW